MMPADSFLKQVPHALEAGPRLILDCCGLAVDSILISFADLEKVAEAMPFDQAAAEYEHRLFVHCWSIIDQCHALRFLLQRLPPLPFRDIPEFIEKTAAYTRIRNSIDHVSTNISNLVNSQQQRAPLFGVVGWIRVEQTDFVDGKLVTYAAHATSRRAQFWASRRPGWSIRLRPK